MSDRKQYAPGPPRGAQVRKDGEKWTLILVRELRHSPEKSLAGAHRPGASARVSALLRSMRAGTVGTTVKLTTVGAPATHALPDRRKDHLGGCAPADMFKRFADVRSLYD